jgi:NitT/TauT family transport system substrate-binding protein
MPDLLFRGRLCGLALLMGGLCTGLIIPGVAQAEVSQLRVGAQFGIGYLPLYVARDAGLFAEELKRAGLPPIPVEINHVAGGPEINDALLAGSLEIGTGGVTAMMLARDRTRGAGLRQMLGIAALSTVPYALLTDIPDAKSIADLKDDAHIGVPAVRISVPAVLLAMSAERTLGAERARQLDASMVALGQPDGATAVLTHNGLVNGYAFSPPFIQQLHGKPGVHSIWSSTDVFGTPTTAISAWTTVKFRSENPKTYAAFLAALRKAVDLIAREPKQVASIYLAAETSKLPQALIEEVLASPELGFGVAPANVGAMGDYMAKIGLLHTKPTSWKDMFFPDIADDPGT